jgi:glycosyltransferase involved in cell wall biosynthesis
MKLFEYLASGRPVVAADTPALRSLVSEHEVRFYIPDDPSDLAHQISSVFSDTDRATQASMKGREKAREHVWAKRAERIRAFIGL